MDALAPVIEDGSYADLLQAIAGLNDKDRKRAAAWFHAQWKATRETPHRRDGAEPLARWMRLLVGLTATAPDPKKALAIPVQYGWWDIQVAFSTDRWIQAVSAESMAALAEAAIGRGADWCASYLAFVLDAKKPKPMFVEVVQLIARAHGLALPATPIAAQLWATRFAVLMRPQGLSVPRFVLERRGDAWSVSGTDLTVTTPAEGLRGGLDTEAMLLSLFDHRDVVIRIVGAYSSQQGMDAAAAIVAELVADGTVDAQRLARQAIAALSRGDAVGCQRLQVRLLKVAKPGAALVREQARVLGSLLASGNVTTAAAAQELLREADGAEALPDDLFGDACQIAFARKEKGLRETQLAWARERAGRAATCAAGAGGLAAALFCPDHGVQLGAVGALESAWPQLDDTARAALLGSIEASRGVLDDTLYDRLWSACTGGAVAAPAAGRPRIEPLRTGLTRAPYEPIADPAQLPSDVTRVLQTYHLDRDAIGFERVIGCAHDLLRAGRLELARAFGEYLKPHRPFDFSFATKERVRVEMGYVAMARLEELQQALADGRPRRFVSTPSWTHGAIDPEDLADRLAALAGDGERALPVDLLVALLRTEACGAPTLARLRAIGTADARAAADFLEAGGAAQLATRWLVLEGGEDAPGWRSRYHCADWVVKGGREVCVALERVMHPPAIDGAPMDWAVGFEAANAPFVPEWDMLPEWITPMLPNNAEALAALHLYGFRRAGLDERADGGKAVAIRLPLFTAAHGPAGPALHLAVLFAMSGNDAPVRLAGSDGMVALLQQGRWRDALAAELIAACIRCGSVKPGRLAASLAQVREAGEADAVWSLALAAIAAALGLETVPAATADLIALAVDVAGEVQARGAIAELDAAVAAIKGKPNKLQSQALRLHDVLGR